MGIIQKARDRREERRRSLAETELAKRIGPAGRRFLDFWGVKVKDLIAKESRSIVPEAETSYGQFFPPPYNPTELQRIYEMHWVVNACISKLVRETTRQGYEWEPLFEARCDACSREYDYTPVSGACPECQASTLTVPDHEQLVRVKAFCEHPNPTLTLPDILKRSVRDLLVFDDFYTSIAKKEGVSYATSAEVLEFWPEDARYIQIIVDAKGRLGGQTFCPIDEGLKKPGENTTLYPADRYQPGSACPKEDGGILLEAAYVQAPAQEAKAAWTKDEIVHTNLYSVGSRLYGTPKLWAIQAQVASMQLLDVYQRDMFDKGKTPKSIFLLAGFEENSFKRQLMEYEQKKKLNPAADMWLAAPMMPDGKGQVGITKIPGLESPLLQGAMEHQDYSFKSICYTFGVSPASIGVETSGKMGAAQEGQEQRDVTPETVNEIQIQVAEAYDRFFKLYFPEILDWKFALKSAHEGEEADVWNVKKVQMEAAKTAVDAGFEVIIDEDGTPKISGSGSRPEPKSPFGEDEDTEGTSAFGKHAQTREKHIHKDGDDCRWVTINGNPVCIGDGGGSTGGDGSGVAVGEETETNIDGEPAWVRRESVSMNEIVPINDEPPPGRMEPLSRRRYERLDPIIVAERADGHYDVMDGEHRFWALREAGVSGPIPVDIFIEWSKEEKKSASISRKHGPGAHDEPGHVGGYQPPAGIGAVGAKVYAECRSGGGDKTSCAKIAWTAQNRADKSIDDVEKANRHRAVIDRAAESYKATLDSIAVSVFKAIENAVGDVLDAKVPDNRVTPEVKMALVERIEKALQPELQNAETLVKAEAKSLISIGANWASIEAHNLGFTKQTPVPRKEQQNRSIEAMRNVLYFGDNKQSYLEKVRAITDKGIEENWTTDQLARELRDQMDPEREHFAGYMWERIARTESAAYVIEGERQTYMEFGIPKLKRLVAPDAVDDLCAPFADAIYKTEDAYGVVPAHPNCRCAFAPYFGDEEPIAG